MLKDTKRSLYAGRGVWLFLIIYGLLVMACGLQPTDCFAQNIKKANLAGSWYPDNPRILEAEINNYLKNTSLKPSEYEIIALICPHAGLAYSGGVTAYGFKILENKRIDTVVLVGFSHKIDFDGIAVFSYEGFETPLGVLATDKKLSEKISSAHEKIFTYPKAFESENSIELILPFIQMVFDKPKIVLLALGRQSWENVQMLGQALAKALKDENNYLLIASTDMSHYFPLAKAIKVDRETVKLLEKMNPEDLFTSFKEENRMCGLGAVTSVMIAAKKLGANELKVLKESTSAEVSGDESRVVGYLSAAMVKDNNEKAGSVRSIEFEGEKNKISNAVEENKKMKELLNAKQKKELLKLARDTISFYLDEGKLLERDTNDEVLKKIMGVFVTLRRKHQLRGCIGNIIGTEPLYLGVRDMAIAAATQDFRFKAVTKEELKDIEIEISVLSPLKQIIDTDEIILGKHGVLVKDAYRSGVYLPQVATETGWNKEEFMDSLCGHKAGMESDAWKNGKCDIYIFSAEVFGE